MDSKYNLIDLNHDFALPLANQLAQRIKWMIAGGIISEGEKLPNIRAMGDFLKIHMHTVRSAYHLLEDYNLVSVKPKTGTIVYKYIPFITSDDALGVDKSLIAILLPEMNDFYNQIFQGIQLVASTKQYLPVAIPCGEEPYIAEFAYANVSTHGFAGVINLSLGFSDEFYEEFKGFQYLNVPLVFVDNFSGVTHSLNTNVEEAVYQAADHLVKHNFNNIALINCPADWPIGHEALKGYSKAIKKIGKELDPDLLFTVPNFSFDAGVFCAQQIIQKKQLPDAFIAVGELLTLGAISTFQNQGFSIPDDIAVIGYNNITPATNLNSTLSTIAFPLQELGQQAMTSLIRILQGKVKTWENKDFPGKLLIRKSCGCNQSSERE